MSAGNGDQRDGYHVFGARCSNCNWCTADLPRDEYLTVPRGVPIGDVECPLCGCKALRGGLTGISATPAQRGAA